MKRKGISNILFVVVCTLALAVIALGVVCLNNLNKKDDSNNDNELIAKTVWYNDVDNSTLVFANEDSFVWYKDPSCEAEDGYLSGNYMFYMGKDAYKAIASLYDEDETLPEYSYNNSLLVLFICDDENVVTKYFYGYYYEDMLNYVDLSSTSTYTFYSDLNMTTVSLNS